MLCVIFASSEHFAIQKSNWYEDPAVDPDFADHGALARLADGLETTYLLGRDEDNDGALDLTIGELQCRFDRTLNQTVPISPTRWSIPNMLRVETDSYPHQDAMMADMDNTTHCYLLPR